MPTFLQSKVYTKRYKLRGKVDPYVIIPVTYVEGDENGFRLKVYCKSGTKCKLIRAAKVAAAFDEVAVDGEWNSANAGGCGNYPGTVYNNPKFTLTLAAGHPDDFIVDLSRPDPSMSHPIAFYLWEPRANGIPYFKWGAVPSQPSGQWSPDPVVRHEIKLGKPTTQERQVVITPTTFEPQQLGKFRVKVLGEGGASLGPLPPVFPAARSSGSWSGSSAGGGPWHDDTTWGNPQLALNITPTSRGVVTLVVKLDEATMVNPFSFYAWDGNQRLTSYRQELASGGTFMSGEAAHEFELPAEVVNAAKAGGVVIMPCLFDPGMTGNFTLEIYGHDVECKITNLQGQEQL